MCGNSLLNNTGLGNQKKTTRKSQMQMMGSSEIRHTHMVSVFQLKWQRTERLEGACWCSKTPADP